MIDPPTGPLRCYTDSVINYGTGISPFCEYSTVGIAEINSSDHLPAVPDPSQGIVDVSIPPAFLQGRYELIDSFGRTLEKGNITSPNPGSTLRCILRGSIS